MKKGLWTAIFLSMVLLGCARGGNPGPSGGDGTSCSVDQTDAGAVISCDDGTQAEVLNGADGLDGQSCRAIRLDEGVQVVCPDDSVIIRDGVDGADGEDGVSCTVQSVSDGHLLTCGTTSVVVDNGVDGLDGVDGESCTATAVEGGVIIQCPDQDAILLASGRDGESCTVTSVEGGAVVSCPGSDDVFVANGQDGQDGEDGTLQGAVFSYTATLAPYTQSILDIALYDVDNTYIGRCTGTKTTTGAVITANHCFPSNADRFSFFNAGQYAGQNGDVFFLGEEGRDVVIVDNVDWNDFGLRLPGLLPTGNWPIRLGEIVGNLSHPLGVTNDVQLTIGYVVDDNLNSTLGSTARWRDAFMADYAAAGGSSGSPVFSYTGEWIGIHVGGFTQGLELSIALPFE